MKKKSLTNKHDRGFQVPENYFEEFGGRVFAKLKSENETPAALFEEQPLASGMEVPQNYFQDFEVELPAPPKVIPLFSKKKWMYAASIAAVFVLIFTIFNQYSAPETSFADLEADSIEHYLESGQIDFSHSEMELFLSEGTNFYQLEFDHIENESIFDYLMNNSREISLINQ